MNEKLERIKNHISENRKIYIAAIAGVVVGAVIVLVVSKHANSGTKIVQKIYQVAWRPENNQVIVNLIEKSTPSKPVHLVGTNLFFDSINEAARQTGHSISMISRNINGHIPDVKGDIFELLEKAS